LIARTLPYGPAGAVLRGIQVDIPQGGPRAGTEGSITP